MLSYPFVTHLRKRDYNDCPDGGQSYLCNVEGQSGFAGCCDAEPPNGFDPCKEGCNSYKISPFYWNIDDGVPGVNQLAILRCEAAFPETPYFCNDTGFTGCCKQDPCAGGEGCPDGKLGSMYLKKEYIAATSDSATSSATALPLQPTATVAATTITSAPLPTTAASESHSHVTPGTAAGIAIAAAAAIALIAILAFLLFRKARISRNASASQLVPAVRNSDDRLRPASIGKGTFSHWMITY